MKLAVIFILAALAMTGCASQDYALYADGQAKVDAARYTADAAKYKAMADIAASGTEAAKVAAVMALAIGQGQSGTQATHLQAPQASSALQWAQVLVPGLTQVAAIHANMQVATVQSNNAARVVESTNASFVGIAGQIQAPASNVSTVTTDSHAQTLAGTGTLGSGAYSTTDSHAATTSPIVAPVIQITPIVAPQPVVTVP